VLTGDTLFIGDVGRPDLLASDGRSADELGRQLYHSLREKILTLPDTTRVFPAHGAGSACGRSLSTETESTIGEQRRTNYALAPMTEDEFVSVVTEGQPASPAYFSYSAGRNRELHTLLGEALAPRALDIDDVLELQRAGAAVLDTRSPTDFAAGHLRGSVNVGLEGRFAEYAGDVIRPEQVIALVSDAGTDLEAKVRLARIGFDNVAGCLRDPMLAFVARPDLVVVASRLTANEFVTRLDVVPGLVVLDVRNPAELTGGSIPGAHNLPLARLLGEIPELDRRAPTVVHCAGGYRSSIAASALRAAGFEDVSDLIGGYDAWVALMR
jgi:hydroxyacylglutathione hydrolase